MSSIKNTHRIPFNHLTDLTLNELLYRVDQNILKDDILNTIHSLPYDISINMSRNNIIKNKIKYIDISIYINYIHKNTKYNIGHTTIHLTGTNFSDKYNGLFHSKNTTRRNKKPKYAIFRVLVPNQVYPYIKFEMPKEEKDKINKDLGILSEHTISILNKYISDDPNEPLSLSIKRTMYTLKHQYLEDIITIRNSSSVKNSKLKPIRRNYKKNTRTVKLLNK